MCPHGYHHSGSLYLSIYVFSGGSTPMKQVCRITHNNLDYLVVSMYLSISKILEVNLFAFAYRLFRRDFSPLDGTYCMGTHSFLQPYMHFDLIWEGFMNG